MASVEKRGTLIEVAAESVFDAFCGQYVLDVILLTDEGKRISARIVPAIGFHIDYAPFTDVFVDVGPTGAEVLQMFPEARHRRWARYTSDESSPVHETDREVGRWDLYVDPAIGDKVSIKWDYENFTGEILEFSPMGDDAIKISADHPRGDKRRIGHMSDLTDSLHPDRTDHTDR